MLPCSCRSPALGVTLVHELSCFKPQQPALSTLTRSNPTTTSSSDPGQTTAAATEQTAVVSASTSVAVSGSASSASGATPAWSSALPGIVSKFRAAVEREMPGIYAWFDESSLHVTVRAIIV